METLKEIWCEYLLPRTGSAFPFAVAVLSIVGMWLLFKKANKAGWRSLIPVVNLYTLVQIGDGAGLKFLLFFIPVVNVIYHVIFNYRLARAFGKGLIYTLGLIFFAPVFILLLGLGNATYRKR